LALAFGYLIVSGISLIFYYSLLPKYGHPTATAVRNVMRIIGIGALVAAIAGAVAGGAAGVALGGFIGIVIGFASQQVLGQAVAGMFLLIARPFKINDNVNLVGEDGIVEDVSTLFTTVIKSDGTKVLIPNNAIIGNKIYLKPVQQQQKSS
jgi:Small-conductance mechanosensitive channel